MTVRAFEHKVPELGQGVWVAPEALVVGDVAIGAQGSVWPMTVVRGDVNAVRIGARSNIQDGSVLHVTHDHEAVPGGHALRIGDDVTVGHRVVLHGCDVGDRCLVGMGATVMDGAVLEAEVMLGAGSLVPPGKRLAGGYLWVGSPARRVRALSEEERARLAYSAEHYVRLAARHAAGVSG